MRYKSEISPKATYLKPLVERLLDSGIPDDAVDIYKGRNRVVRCDYAGHCINIKSFRIPHIINRIVYGTGIRGSKARRAYLNAKRLLAMGIGTPEPLAFAEEFSGPLLCRSFLVTEQLSGYSDLRTINTLPFRDELIDAVAALMVELHRKGVWMKDFSQGNILWRRLPDGTFDLRLIDINRMAFNVTSTSRLMSNFKTIGDDEQTIEAYAKAYAAHSGSDSREIIALALAAREAYLKKRRIKRTIRHKK